MTTATETKTYRDGIERERARVLALIDLFDRATNTKLATADLAVQMLRQWVANPTGSNEQSETPCDVCGRNFSHDCDTE